MDFHLTFDMLHMICSISYVSFKSRTISPNSTFTKTLTTFKKNYLYFGLLLIFKQLNLKHNPLPPNAIFHNNSHTKPIDIRPDLVIKVLFKIRLREAVFQKPLPFLEEFKHNFRVWSRYHKSRVPIKCSWMFLCAKISKFILVPG